MKTKSFVAVCVLSLGFAGNALAKGETAGLTGQALMNQIVQDLAAEGFGQFRVKKMPFGRVSVIGYKKNRASHVTFSPRSGKIHNSDNYPWPRKSPAWDPNEGPDFADIEGYNNP
jgi:hypothetical protein